MRKLLAIILTCVILTAVASSCAEYKKYRLTEGNAGGNAGIIPLDAHNAVVIARPEGKGPWHVTWYRDGGKYLDLSGQTNDPAVTAMEIPYPAVWDGEHLTMICNERTGKTEKADTGADSYQDPGNYRTYLAKWTENGLERIGNLPESWYSSYQCGESIIFREGNRWSVRHGGKDTILSDNLQIGPDAAISDCIPLNDDAFLLVVNNTAGSSRQLICADHEKVKCRIRIPAGAYLQAWDGQGGFFSTDDWPSGDYTPLALAHYNADGQKDRTLKLGGNNVVVQFFGTSVDQGTGLCTLYGSAVANSRKVYTVFAMTLDAGLNVCGLDVRKIDPAYGDYGPGIYIAGDGTAWVYICDMKKRGLRPVLIPFPQLEQSKEDYGLALW